jgi:hypothetical protein
MGMKILYIRQKNGVFLKGFINNLDKENYNIFVLDLMHGEYINYNENRVYNLVNVKFLFRIQGIKYLMRYIAALMFMIKYQKERWDICHVLNIKRENFWLLPFMKNNSKKVILTVYGRSTFINPIKRILFKSFYKYFDNIAFENKYTLNEFKSYNNHVDDEPLIINYPPINHFRASDFSFNLSRKARAVDDLGLDNNLIRISCSSTILSNDQHFKIIDALALIKNKDKVQLMFLLTYGGSPAEMNKIVNYIDTRLQGFNVKIFKQFLSDLEIRQYRYATDIYINMRKTDQLAGAVLESLASGALLISAKWLNYSNFDDMNVNYKIIDGFENLPRCIDDSVLSLDKFQLNYSKSNSNKIIKEYSLEVVLNKWISLYKIKR